MIALTCRTPTRSSTSLWGWAMWSLSACSMQPGETSSWKDTPSPRSFPHTCISLASPTACNRYDCDHQGTTVIANLTSALFDKNEWETPFAFNPGHFLDEEGRFQKRTAFIPFSAGDEENSHLTKSVLKETPSLNLFILVFFHLVGRRLCLGENLARMMLFLFFTSFMQDFTISFPAGVSPVMEYHHFGVTLAPHPFDICAVSR